MIIKIINPHTNKVEKQFTPLKEIELSYTNYCDIISWNDISIETTKENQIIISNGDYSIEIEGAISSTLTGKFKSLTIFGKNDGISYLTYVYQIYSVSNIRIPKASPALVAATAYDCAMEIIKTRNKNVY